MNISRLVNDTRKSAQTQGPAEPLPAPAEPKSHLLHEYKQDMASAQSAGPYVNQSPAYTRPPQPPPSPPSDDPESLRTLPSISSLIRMESHPAGQIGGETHTKLALAGEDQPGGHRPQVYGQPTVSNPNNRPLSPPIDPQLGFDSHVQSPSAASSHSSTMAGATPGAAEPSQLKSSAATSSNPHVAPTSTSQSPYQGSQISESPSTSSAFSYPEPGATSSQPMFEQRPLPSRFSPANISGHTSAPTGTSNETSPTEATTPNQWQHHHYIASSTSTAFSGQTQDRYICQVCNKAFSRPSSLRIHSHSHTGEKPFQCPHKGCGKAFSVRSNMKRHERGCHGTDSPGGS